MPTATDTAFLDKALSELESVRRWSPRTISKLESLINSPDAWAVYRVDPLRFAAERGMAEQESIDLFLHAANIGLFNMEWRLLCPVCSDTVSSCRTMSTVQSRCYCQLCQMSVEVNLDDYIAISFNLSPRVRELPWHKPENLSAEDYLLRYRIDQNAVYEGLGKLSDILRSFHKLFDTIGPGQSRTVEFDVLPGFAVVGFDAGANRSFILTAQGEPSATRQQLRAEAGREDWVLSSQQLLPGPVRVQISNPTQHNLQMALYARPNGEMPPTLRLGTFLTGNRLLNNQTFRTLYRAETLASGEGVGVRDLTLLFTDLKGSTELYERVGDLAAFALVQQHFEHLRQAVQQQEGAVVKTIGDAVMASFNQPADAVKAALAMHRDIEAFNSKRGNRDLILKIGLHRGHSIAVTLNDRLDYFGQTVNIAARVQGVANSDEMCVTTEVIQAPGVRELLAGHDVREESARLKGISDSMQVYRVKLG